MPYFKSAIPMDGKLVCRSCLFSGTNMKFLMQRTIKDAFIDATKIEVYENDGLPNWLCNYCYSVLLKIIQFKVLASKTDNILKNMMKTGNGTMKELTINSSFGMLTHATISYSDACDDCDKIPDNHINYIKHSFERKEDFIPISDKISEKINVTHKLSQIEEDGMKTERPEDSFTSVKSYYSSENDSFNNEIKDFSSKKSSENKRKGELESENSPLIFIANSLRLASNRKRKCLRSSKLHKFQEKKNHKSPDDKKIDRLTLDEINIETKAKIEKQLENNIFQNSRKEFYHNMPKFENNIKTNKICDNVNSYRKSQKKQSKTNITKEAEKIINESKLCQEKRVSGKIENESTAVVNCDMSRVAIIEMNLDEQVKELQIKQESEQFKSARYKCVKCIKVFPYEDSLKNHMIRHDQSYGSCECSLCGQRFLTLRVLKSHQIAHSKRYRCLECARILKFKATVTHHMMRHDGTYSCRMCGHLSLNKEANKLHQRIHTHQDTYNCPLCPKVLSSKQDYGIHMRRHSGDMPFECSDCMKLFLTNAALQSHRAVHSSARHFYCADCDVSFKTRDIMLTHFRKSSRHIDPALLRYQCDLCPKRFLSKETLASHSDSYHTRSAKLACDACPARFVSSNGLRNHKRTVHEGFRPRLTHVCEACGRAFSTKALVTNHLRTHTGEQPFECPTCHRRFSQRSAMQTHIKLVHLKIKRNMSIPKDIVFSTIQSECRLPLDSSQLVKL